MFQGLWGLWFRIWHLCFGTYSQRKGWRGSLLVGWTTMLVCLCCLYWFLHLLPLPWRAPRCGLLAGKTPSLRLDHISYGNHNCILISLNCHHFSYLRHCTFQLSDCFHLIWSIFKRELTSFLELLYLVFGKQNRHKSLIQLTCFSCKSIISL